jgi:hypothetical protein
LIYYAAKPFIPNHTRRQEDQPMRGRSRDIREPETRPQLICTRTRDREVDLFACEKRESLWDLDGQNFPFDQFRLVLSCGHRPQQGTPRTRADLMCVLFSSTERHCQATGLATRVSESVALARHHRHEAWSGGCDFRSHLGPRSEVRHRHRL